MTIKYKNLCRNHKVTGTTNATTDQLYLASNGDAQINEATAYNSDATNSVTLYFYILASGEAATDFQPMWAQQIAAGTSDILGGLLGHVVPSGGTIECYASAADDGSVTISGIDIV